MRPTQSIFLASTYVCSNGTQNHKIGQIYTVLRSKAQLEYDKARKYKAPKFDQTYTINDARTDIPAHYFETPKICPMLAASYTSRLNVNKMPVVTI